MTETILEPILLDADLSVEEYDLEVGISEITKDVDIATTIQVANKPYEGSYSVIPGDEEVVLETSGKTMTGNVIVEKIPSNYGKITWNGIGTALNIS